MDFELNEDRRMLSDTLTRFLDDNYDIEKRHGFVMSDDRFSREMWGRFAELGIIGSLFPESAGGFGGEGDDLMVVFEALGKKLVVEPFLPALLAGTLLSRAGNKDWHTSLMEQLISGTIHMAFAHGEPASRYDLNHVDTRASKNEHDEWRISGHKSVVLGGASADWLIVSARTSGDFDEKSGISLFLVDTSAGDISKRDYGTLDGYPAAEIILSGAKGELLGEEGKAYPFIEAAIARATVAVCSEAFGAMEAAKDLTVEYMHTRKQFGVPIGKFQVLQHRMADVLIELEQMRSAIINAAGNLESERAIREREISACKHLCGMIGRQVAEESIQIHGGMGMTWEYPVGHYSKRIIMIDHLFGDTDHHLERYIELGRVI